MAKLHKKFDKKGVAGYGVSARTCLILSSAQKYSENAIVFERLGNLPKITGRFALCSAVIFALLGIISQKFASSVILHYFIASVSVILFVAFLYRDIIYWNRITTK